MQVACVNGSIGGNLSGVLKRVVVAASDRVLACQKADIEEREMSCSRQIWSVEVCYQMVMR